MRLHRPDCQTCPWLSFRAARSLFERKHRFRRRRRGSISLRPGVNGGTCLRNLKVMARLALESLLSSHFFDDGRQVNVHVFVIGVLNDLAHQNTEEDCVDNMFLKPWLCAWSHDRLWRDMCAPNIFARPGPDGIRLSSQASVAAVRQRHWWSHPESQARARLQPRSRFWCSTGVT